MGGPFGQRHCERAARGVREEHRDQQEQRAQVRQADVASRALQQIERECAEQHDLDRALPIADHGGRRPLDARSDRYEARQPQRDLQQREQADHLESGRPGQVGREARGQAASLSLGARGSHVDSYPDLQVGMPAVGEEIAAETERNAP